MFSFSIFFLLPVDNTNGQIVRWWSNTHVREHKKTTVIIFYYNKRRRPIYKDYKGTELRFAADDRTIRLFCMCHRLELEDRWRTCFSQSFEHLRTTIQFVYVHTWSVSNYKCQLRKCLQMFYLWFFTASLRK